MEDAQKSGKEFEELVRILDILRGEKGCPWDREQDEKSITNYFLEEVYEAIEAIYSGDAAALSEELGDVLMEVVLLARIFKEKRKFAISDVVEGINRKMIRRHPHVFGEDHIESYSKVREEWDKQKMREKLRASIFDRAAKHTPALLAAYEIGNRASQSGFDWAKVSDVLDKAKEEISELEKALLQDKKEEILYEMGDVLFSLANVSRHIGVNPEIALKTANDRFVRRFQYIEKALEKKGKDLESATFEEMDRLWDEAKGEVE